MRASYIEKYYSAFGKRGVDLSLVLTDEPFFTGAGEERKDGLHNLQPKGIHESRPEGISDFGSGGLHNAKPEPDFAIVRVMDPSISAGLEKRGIRCFNSSRVSALANDYTSPGVSVAFQFLINVKCFHKFDLLGYLGCLLIG